MADPMKHNNELRDRIADLVKKYDFDSYPAEQMLADNILAIIDQDRWKPISEAPDSQDEILTIDAAHGKSSQQVVWRHGRIGCWMSKNDKLSAFFTPTHYMPLAAGPEDN